MAAILADQVELGPQPQLVTSPQGRAVETARILADRLGIADVRVDPRLAEVSLGSWDGLTEAEVMQRWPTALRPGERWYFRSPDGESWDAVVARVSAWLDDWIRRGPLVAVSHGLTGRILRGLYAGLTQDAALTQPVPQDRAFRLRDGQVTLV